MYLHCEKLPYTIKTNIKTIKTQTLKKTFLLSIIRLQPCRHDNICSVT